ncbi:unnamed protein product, partial [Scytosiphon promiscuus]
MESSWNKRGYGSAINRSVEVWIFGAKILIKELRLRKVGDERSCVRKACFCCEGATMK